MRLRRAVLRAAPVNGERLRGDEPRPGIAQQYDGARDVLGHPDSAGRRPLDDLLLVEHAGGDRARDHRRAHGAGKEGIDPHTARQPWARRACASDRRRPPCSPHRAPGPASQPCGPEGGDIDDGAAARRPTSPGRTRDSTGNARSGSRRGSRSTPSSVNSSAGPILLTPAAFTRIVASPTFSATAYRRRVDQGGGANVEGEPGVLGSERGCDALSHCTVARRDGDAGSFVGKRSCDGLADALAPPDDDRDVAGKTRHEIAPMPLGAPATVVRIR